MIAIEKTLDMLHGKDIDKDILLLTDSKSTCKSLLNNKMAHTPRSIVNIREVITKIKEKEHFVKEKEEGLNKIVIGWILDYKKILNNEAADKLAKETTRMEFDQRIKVPTSD